jgi:hypothetical protein
METDIQSFSLGVSVSLCGEAMTLDEHFENAWKWPWLDGAPFVSTNEVQ